MADTEAVDDQAPPKSRPSGAKSSARRQQYSVGKFSEQFGIALSTIQNVTASLEPANTLGNRRLYWADQVMAGLLEHEASKRRSTVSGDAKERVEKARAEKLEIANAQARGDLVPVVDVVGWKSREAAMLARALDSVPGRVKRAYPDTPAKILALVSDEIAKARNAFVDSMESMEAELSEEGGWVEPEE